MSPFAHRYHDMGLVGRPRAPLWWCRFQGFRLPRDARRVRVISTRWAS